ncbi:MAG: ADOP family duplicated permease [Bryobacteraceae bacterium]|nr:ADOP family duplicated permease [Bryobacteraceae bacterium]
MLHDLRFALRTLLRNASFALASVAVLALGIGATTAVFSVVWAVLLKPLPYPSPHRLVQLWGTSPQRGIPFHFLPYSDVSEWPRSGVFSEFTAYQPVEMTLFDRSEPERAGVMRVNAAFLPLFGASYAIGRAFTPAEDLPGAPPVAVMGHGLWQRRYGANPGVIGRPVELDGRAYRVIGVLAPSFSFGSRPADFYIPFALPSGRSAATATPVGAFARLRTGAGLTEALSGVRKISSKRTQGPQADVAIWPLHAYLVRDLKGSLRLAALAVACVLVLAFLNAAILHLARAAARRDEFAVRAALGAPPSLLLRQVCVEAILPTTAAAALGIALAAVLLKLLPALPPERFPLLQRATLDAPVVAFTVLVSVLAALAGAAVPALAIRPRLYSARSVTARTFAHNALIAAEIAFALLLSTAAALVVAGLARLQHTPTGFDPAGVLTANVSLSPSSLQQLLARLNAQPPIEAAGATNVLPMSPGNTATWFLPEGRPTPPPTEIPTVWWRTVDPGYLRALRIPLRRGRFLSPSEPERVVLINETLARRFWPGEDPIGRRFFNTTPANRPTLFTIVGIVADLRHDPAREPEPEVYALWEQFPSRTLSIAIRTRSGRPSDAAPLLRAALLDIDPRAAVSKQSTLPARVDAALAPHRLNALVLGVFGILGVVLAATGVYALVSFSAAQRTREMGVRHALGATRQALVREMLLEVLKPAAAGLALGAAALAAAFAPLRSLVFGLTPRDALTAAAVAAALLTVAALAVVAPALRATASSPSQVLRER